MLNIVWYLGVLCRLKYPNEDTISSGGLAKTNVDSTLTCTKKDLSEGLIDWITTVGFDWKVRFGTLLPI